MMNYHHVSQSKNQLCSSFLRGKSENTSIVHHVTLETFMDCYKVYIKRLLVKSARQIKAVCKRLETAWRIF